MNGSRSERARARARYRLAQIASLPTDGEMQRLRQLSMKYIREAERLERDVQPSGRRASISAASDAIARDFFARALQNELKE